MSNDYLTLTVTQLYQATLTFFVTPTWKIGYSIIDVCASMLGIKSLLDI